MKRIVSAFIFVILAALISLSSTMAEEIIMHSGVKFGMTIDEVIDAEGKNGFQSKKEDLYDILYSDDEIYAEYKSERIVIQGTIAGIDDSRIYYYFDNNGKLFDVVYIFKGGNIYAYNGSSNDNIIDEYDNIQAQLENKYSDLWEESVSDFPNTIDEFLIGASSLYDISSHKIRINDKECVYLTHCLSVMEAGGLSVVEVDEFDLETLVKSTGQHYLEYRVIADESKETTDKAIQEKEEREK